LAGLNYILRNNFNQLLYVMNSPNNTDTTPRLFTLKFALG